MRTDHERVRQVWVPRCDEPNGVVVIDAAKNRIVKVIRPGVHARRRLRRWQCLGSDVRRLARPHRPEDVQYDCISPKGLQAFSRSTASRCGLSTPTAASSARSTLPRTRSRWTTTVPEPPFGSAYLDAYQGKLWFSSDAPALGSLTLLRKPSSSSTSRRSRTSPTGLSPSGSAASGGERRARRVAPSTRRRAR